MEPDNSSSAEFSTDPPVQHVELETPMTCNTLEDEAKVGEKRLRSVVWQHFKKINVEGVDKAECNYCKKLLGAQRRNGTKHLHEHHKVCKMRPFKNMRQQTLLQQQWKVDGKMCISNYTFDQETSRKELASMTIMH